MLRTNYSLCGDGVQSGNYNFCYFLDCLHPRSGMVVTWVDLYVAVLVVECCSIFGCDEVSEVQVVSNSGTVLNKRVCKCIVSMWRLHIYKANIFNQAVDCCRA